MPVHQNSLKALEAYKWKPGQVNPNPGGRPKGLAARIRELEKERGPVIDLVWRISEGLEKGFGARERLRASEILLERGWGKTPEIQLQGDLDQSVVSSELSNYSAEQLRDLLKSLAAKKAQPQETTKESAPLQAAAG